MICADLKKKALRKDSSAVCVREKLVYLVVGQERKRRNIHETDREEDEGEGTHQWACPHVSWSSKIFRCLERKKGRKENRKKERKKRDVLFKNRGAHTLTHTRWLWWW